MGSYPTGYYISHSVRNALLELLQLADHHTPPFHNVHSWRVASVVLLSRSVYQRCKVVYPDHGLCTPERHIYHECILPGKRRIYACSLFISDQNNRLARLHVQVPAFAAALVLLLNIWSAKLAGFSFDLTKEIGDVHKAMQAIKSYENRYTPFLRLY